MNKLAVSLLTLTAVAAAFADAPVKNFPNTDGSGDMASATAWNDAFPASTDTIQLNKSYGMPLTFSKSCTFEDLFVGKEKTTNTIEITKADVVVKLLGVQDGTPGIQNRGSTDTLLRFKGGTYDLNNKGNFGPSRYGYGYHRDAFIVEDVVLTNVANVGATYSGNQSRLIVSNSTIYATSTGNMMDSNNGSNMIGGYTEFAAGTKVYSGSSLGLITRGITNSTFLATGEGTVLTALVNSATTVFAANCSNNLIRIEDHAAVSIANVYGCNGAGCGHNDIVISGFASLGVRGDIYWPMNATAHHNAIKVMEDGFYESSAMFRFQGQDMSVIVSNGHFKSASAFSYDGVRNTVRILGPKATFDIPNSYIFSGAKQSAYEFGAGATWSMPVIYMANGGCSNAFVVTGGAKVAISKFLGRSYGATSSYGNTVRVSDGGTLECSTSYGWDGWDNTTIISNGTLSCGQLNIGDIRDDVATEASLTDTCNRVVFQGTSPKIVSTGANYMRRGAIVRFEVPRGGYPEGAALWECSAWYCDYGAAARFELAGVDEELVRSLEKPMDVALIKTTGGNVDYYLGDQVRAVAKTLHPRAKLYITEDKKELHLSVKPYTGFTVIVK